ncbi:MAG TPA: NUDIX hydrolase [Thiotrichales bacterium]|nr:NUDIX hydrolase [Thiotrichales bacterium]
MSEDPAHYTLLPHLTVAVVVEKEGRFLLVEEATDGDRVVYNQPAGHVEPEEELLAAAVRETREETGWEVEPVALLGLYRYHSPWNGVTYHRVCFVARPLSHDREMALDEGILRAAWLSRDEIASRPERLRSPLVLRVIDDYLAGRRHPLDVIREVDE